MNAIIQDDNLLSHHGDTGTLSCSQVSTGLVTTGATSTQELEVSAAPVSPLTDDDQALRRVITAEENSQQQRDAASNPITIVKAVSPVSKESSPRKDHTTRRSHTLLSSLLFEKKYLDANTRVRERPEEAFIWVHKEPSSPKRATKCIAPPRETIKSDKEDESYHRLPLHIACTNLASEVESKKRFQLEQLILRLVLVFPDATSMVDHEQTLPLHQAICNNATPETVSMLLMANPASAYIKDQCGRNAAELNRHRRGVFFDQVKELLSMGRDFWENARTKAENGFRNHQHFALHKPEEKKDKTLTLCVDLGDHNTAYDSSLTVDLESVSIVSESFQYATIEQSEKTHISYSLISPEKHSMVSDLATSLGYSVFPPMEERVESEAEVRAAILQTMLDDLNEKNQQLTDVNIKLCNQVEERSPVSNDLHSRVDALESEKAVLLKKLLHQQIQSKRYSPTKPPRPASPSPSPPVVDEVIELKMQNEALKRKVERLKAKRNKQAERIDYLKSIVADDVLLDFSDSETASTFSVLDSVVTESTPADTTDDEFFSTTSSFQRRLASDSKSEVNEKATDNRGCLIEGLASFRFDDFVARMQRKVSTSPETVEEKDFFNPIKTDSLNELCGMAAEIYVDVIKEGPKKGRSLILEWEPPVARKTPLLASPISHHPCTPKHGGITPKYVAPSAIPSHYLAMNHDLNSIVSFSETSLSSIGMNSRGKSLWI